MDQTCLSGHYVASCQVSCPTTAHLCNPSAQFSQCMNTQTCSDPSSVGLPAGAGFGLCQ
jgi:hypothetical protein